MSTQLNTKGLAELQIFRDVDENILKRVIQTSTVVSLEKDDSILKNKQKNNTLFVLLEGTLDVYINFQDFPISRMFPGQIFGEISLLDKKTISASVKAKETSIVLNITEDMFWDLIENSHSFSKNMINILANRLRSFSDQVNSLEGHQKDVLENNIDELTGLYNREWFDKHFPTEIDNAKIQKTSLILLMLEIKTDKQMGDTLRALSKNLQLRFRGFQNLSRYDKSKIVATISRSELNNVKNICNDCSTEINSDDFNLHFSFSQLTPVDTEQSIIKKCLKMLKSSRCKKENQVLDWRAFS